LSSGLICVRSGLYEEGKTCLRTGILAADNPLAAARLPAAATEVLLPAVEDSVLPAVLLKVVAVTAVPLKVAAVTALLPLVATAVRLPADTAAA
jgi:hypothetical protein